MGETRRNSESSVPSSNIQNQSNQSTLKLVLEVSKFLIGGKEYGMKLENSY
jgi:hypothetical protein